VRWFLQAAGTTHDPSTSITSTFATVYSTEPAPSTEPTPSTKPTPSTEPTPTTVSMRFDMDVAWFWGNE